VPFATRYKLIPADDFAACYALQRQLHASAQIMQQAYEQYVKRSE